MEEKWLLLLLFMLLLNELHCGLQDVKVDLEMDPSVAGRGCRLERKNMSCPNTTVIKDAEGRSWGRPCYCCCSER